jgi:hypothetical protein
MPQTMHFDDLPASIHTGPVKFGHDWTGFFIRGDHCWDKAKRLKMIAAILETHDDGVARVLANWAKDEAMRLESVTEA